jgi:hypothetical protein
MEILVLSFRGRIYNSYVKKIIFYLRSKTIQRPINYPSYLYL